MYLVPRPRSPRATFCLNMIVRDEAHVITRCLNSVRNMVDFVRIVDTGSTDDTIHLIREWCLNEGVNCVVKSEKWADFATNRNQALELAHECDATHLVLIDADEVMHITDEEVRTLRVKLQETDQALFAIPMVYGNNVCTRVNIARNMWTRLAYQFPIHEELTVDGDPKPSITMIGNPKNYTQGPHVTTPQDGARSQDPNRLERDLQTLTDAYNTKKNPRHLFYMGQVLRISASTSDDPELWAAVRDVYTAYLLAMGKDNAPHCYVAALWVARVMEMEQAPWEKVADTYLKAYALDPGRPEAMGCLASLCMDHGKVDKAREFAARVEGCRGSSNYGFLETHWYQNAKDILKKTEAVTC